MTKYFCDRCGSSSDKMSHVSKLNYQYEKDYGGEIIVRADLCEYCSRQLEEFVKPLPKEGRMIS